MSIISKICDIISRLKSYKNTQKIHFSNQNQNFCKNVQNLKVLLV